MLKRFLPFFIVCLLSLFSSCEKCELEREYRIQIDWHNTFYAFDQSDYWQNFAADSLQYLLNEQFASIFPEAGQIVLTDTLPDYILRIERIDGIGEVSQQTLEDPCQEEHTPLHNFVFGGPETSTFTLHSCRITAELILLNAYTGNGKRFTCKGISGETTSQPPTTDTINCNGYIVTGEVHPRYASQSLGITIRNETKSQICNLTRQNP